jgi:His-Xaa-Ser system radical SAM maturase HxsC
MRKVPAAAKGFAPRTIVRVTSMEHLTAQWKPELQLLVPGLSLECLDKHKQLLSSGVTNVALLTASQELFNLWDGPVVLDKERSMRQGDVAAVGDEVSYAHILIRETDRHHTVFLTNRCNSNCLMCSQPPTSADDSWLIDEACQVAIHMNESPALLGFSGGEPLLLGEGLRKVLDTFISHHPTTDFDLLSNGRLLAHKPFSDQLLNGLDKQISWMIPLYGHVDFLHDFVVQSHGAFEETIAGLLHLHAQRQAIQLRTVLIRPVLEHLPAVCEFIAKNLPFVREVALMACEPIGFALANRDLSDIDLRDWEIELRTSINVLERAHINVILMNTPLCVLHPELWKYAHKSISDWKQEFASECAECSVKADCVGVFSWHFERQQAMKIKRIEGVANV